MWSLWTVDWNFYTFSGVSSVTGTKSERTPTELRIPLSAVPLWAVGFSPSEDGTAITISMESFRLAGSHLFPKDLSFEGFSWYHILRTVSVWPFWEDRVLSWCSLLETPSSYMDAASFKHGLTDTVGVPGGQKAAADDATTTIVRRRHIVTSHIKLLH